MCQMSYFKQKKNHNEILYMRFVICCCFFFHLMNIYHAMYASTEYTHRISEKKEKIHNHNHELVENKNFLDLYNLTFILSFFLSFFHCDLITFNFIILFDLHITYLLILVTGFVIIIVNFTHKQTFVLFYFLQFINF